MSLPDSVSSLPLPQLLDLRKTLLIDQKRAHQKLLQTLKPSVAAEKSGLDDQMRQYIKKAEEMKYARAKEQIQHVYNKIRSVESTQEYNKNLEADMAQLVDIFGPTSKKIEELQKKVDELKSINDEALKKLER